MLLNDRKLLLMLDTAEETVDRRLPIAEDTVDLRLDMLLEVLLGTVRDPVVAVVAKHHGLVPRRRGRHESGRL